MNKFYTLLILALVGCSQPAYHSENPILTDSTASPAITATSVMDVENSFYDLKNISKRDEKNVSKLQRELKSRQCDDFCSIVPKRVVAPKKISIISFSYKNLAKLQSQSVELNQKSLKKIKSQDLVKNYEKFEANQSCPQNLTAAVLNKVDDASGEAGMNVYKKLYSQVAACPVNQSLENTYLRSALIFYNFKQLPEAKLAISKALEVKDPVDYARINYWAAVILQDPSYYKKVIDNRPYTYHAVVSAQKLNLSLWDIIKKRPQIDTVRKDDLLTKSVEKLLYFNHSDEAYTLITLNMDKLSSSELLYFTKLFNRHARVDVAIKLVSKISTLYPEKVNDQIISLAYKTDFFDLFSKNSLAYNLDPYLLLSLSKQESGLFPKARSKANARGLMQLMPATARLINKSKARDLYNVENNVYLGTKYFNTLFVSFNKVDQALAGYNAGPLNVKKWVGIYGYQDSLLFADLIPFKETRTYVSSILRNHYFYNSIYAPMVPVVLPKATVGKK